MAGTKKQQKTLLNKLFDEARRTDLPQLPRIEYPLIKTKSKDSVEYFMKNEWAKIVDFVVEQ